MTEPHRIAVGSTLGSWGARVLVCGACLVSAPAFSTTAGNADAWEHELRRRGVDPAAIENPLALSDEMRDIARAAVGSGTEMQRLQRLHRFLFDEEGFPFDYRSAGTYSAIDAFQLRRGNCVSFTMLFIALARAAGLPVRAALPKVTPTVEKAGDLVVVSDHVVAIHELPDGAAVFDFYRPRGDPLVGLRPIDDMWITAIYLNNLGAEALLDGQLQTAARRLEHAVALAPDFAPSFGNLGLVRRRLGDVDGAFVAYRQSLAIDPGSSTVLTNLASLYLLLGREPEARAALAAADRHGQTPYTLLVRGDFEMRDGKLRRALRLFRRAARTGPELADPHLAIARAEMARGRTRAARNALVTALTLEPDHAEAQRDLAELDESE